MLFGLGFFKLRIKRVRVNKPVLTEHLLDAVQGSEDKTKEKVDAKKAKVVGRSGKNW